MKGRSESRYFILPSSSSFSPLTPSTPHLLFVFPSLASLIFLSVGLCVVLHFPPFCSFLKWVPSSRLLLLPLFFQSDLSPQMPTSVSHLRLIHFHREPPVRDLSAKS